MRSSERGSRVAVAVGLVACVCAGLVVVAACDNQAGTYVYRGRRYNPEKMCLEDRRALDVVDSNREPALCLPICLVQTAYDGGLGVYVSSTCPPYPYGFDTTGREPTCVAALRAARQANGCLSPLPDGGPDAAPDSGADASADGGEDASADAATDGGVTDATVRDASPEDASPDANDAGTE